MALLLLMSILVPSFLTAVNVSRNRPLIVVSSDEWIKFKRSRDTYSKARLILLQILIVFPLTPFVPGLVMMSEQKAIDRRKTLKDKIDKKEIVSVCAHFFDMHRCGYRNVCLGVNIVFPRRVSDLE